MSTVSAGLVKVENLTASSSSSPAVNTTNLNVNGELSFNGVSLNASFAELNEKLDSLLTTVELVQDSNLEINTTLKYAGVNHNVYVTVPPNYDPHGNDLYPTVLFLPGLGENRTEAPWTFTNKHSIPAWTSKRGVLYDASGAATKAWSQFINIYVSYANERETLLHQGVFGLGTEESYIQSVVDKLLPRLKVDMDRLFLMGASTGGQGIYDNLIPGRSTMEFDKIVTFSSSSRNRYSGPYFVTGVYGTAYWNYQDVGEIGVDNSGNEFPGRFDFGTFSIVPDTSNSRPHISFAGSIYYNELDAIFSYSAVDPSGLTYGPQIKLRAFLSKTDYLYCHGVLQETLNYMTTKGADTLYLPSFGGHMTDFDNVVYNLTPYPFVTGQPDMTLPEYLLSNF